MSSDQPVTPDPAAQPRKPRKIFLLIGVVIAAGLGVGLFTGVGTSPGSTATPHEGGPVPSFTASRLNGPGTVSVPGDGGGGGTPAVLLFFGNWCESCHQELPPLATAVRDQQRAGGALASIHVIGIDSGDTVANAKAFVRASGVTFPVAEDQALQVVEQDFLFNGDPYAVFVRADGTIDRIVRGAVLTPNSLRADERALIPSGS